MLINRVGILSIVVLASCRTGCSDEFRESAATASIGAEPSLEISAAIGISQNHQQPIQDVLGWQLASTVYKGHIKSAVLYDNRDPSRIIATFPITNPDADIFSQGSSRDALTLGVTTSEVYELLRTSEAHLKLTTDLASPTEIDTALTPGVSSSWRRLDCVS